MNMKKSLAAALALCLGWACLAPSAALAAQKSEIIYVNLSSSGALEQVYVVNRFESEAEETVMDYGAYSSVSNLTNQSPLELLSDGVRLALPQGTLFYQGDPVTAALPWRFAVEYLLDGVSVPAGRLSGASGALEMRFSIGPGSQDYEGFYQHYALTMTVTLDGEKCKNITAENATIANSGADRVLTYTILPSPDETYVITCQATNFSMPDIQINALPLGMDVEIDTSQISSQISRLRSGISQLDSGSAQMASGVSQLQSGADALTEGAGTLAAGAQSFSAGLDAAKSGSAQLAAASAQLVDAAGSLGSQSGGVSLGQLRTCCQGLLSVIDGLEGVLDGLSGGLGGADSAAAAYCQSSEQILSAISQSAFSDSDLSLLNQLLSRSSQSADVTRYLSAEIAALGRVLDNAAAIGRHLETLENCAQDNLAQANQLSQQIAQMASGLEEAGAQLSQARASLESILSLLNGMSQGGASQDASAMEGLLAMLAQLDQGIQSLDQGIGELQDNFSQLSAGIASVDQGAASLAEGVDSLRTGAKKLKKGAGELDSDTSDMDSQLEEEVDDAVSSITGGDYQPVSYMDPRNDVELVQFVLRIPGIEEPEEPEPEVQEQPEKNFFEKFLDLFRG